jgi:hypothetical protein
MGSAYLTLNLPLSIVYLYHPDSRQWSWLAVLAVPGLVLPALIAITRLFRQHAGAPVMAACCLLGGTIAAAGHHLALVALAHAGVYLGDRIGTTRLPGNLQADISFWKKHFAETPGYWLPNATDVFDLVLLFALVAGGTAAFHISRQRPRTFDPEPTFARQHTPDSLKMPV